MINNLQEQHNTVTKPWYVGIATIFRNWDFMPFNLLSGRTCHVSTTNLLNLFQVHKKEKKKENTNAKNRKELG